MILFFILMIILAILVTFIILAVSTAGASAIIIFGDVIMCVCIIIWILKKILNKKSNEN